ncbi:MAG TPA: hypothetical protein PLE85_06945 [Bacteroidales bacterium]|nr:hypothetical protein [Bacteroidales bacterium]
MKRKITAYIILCSLWIIPAGVVSQDFSQALGLRGGSSSGISYKSYMGNLGTLHGLLSFRNDGIQAHVLIEKYKPVFEEYTNDLFLFTGFGGHVGFSRWYQREAWDDHKDPYDYPNRFGPVVGADVALGLAYRLESIPLMISLDCKPYVDVLGRPFIDIHLWDMAFSLHYVLQ